MGLLFGILTLPMSGPMKGLISIARHIKEQIDQQIKPLDPQTELLQLEMLHEIGQIGDEEYFQRQEELLLLLEEEHQNLQLDLEGEAEPLSDEDAGRSPDISKTLQPDLQESESAQKALSV